MRILPFAVALLCLSPSARADDAAPEGAAPLQIAIDCQGYGRTKACPAFLLGFVEHNPLFLSAPRSDAQVVLYYNVTEVANSDRIFLRFVGDLPGAPPAVEITVDLDTRATDDVQIAQLEPAFTRGAALYVAALHPEAVQIALVPIDNAPIVVPHTTPWGFGASVSGFGSWTGGGNGEGDMRAPERDHRYVRSGDYTNANVYANASVSRVERTSLFNFGLSGNYSLNKSPHVITEAGEEISFDTHQWGVNAYTSAERHIDDHWSTAAFSSTWRSDPKGQFRYGWDLNLGVEYDKYQADDPRGNQLFVAYLAGWQIDKYNLRNELGQTFAQYPNHGLYAGGTVRKDKIGFGLSMVAQGELIHPERRHTLSISPFVDLQVGAHIDLSFSFSVTERAVPGPDPDLVDTADPELLSRLSYAQPLSGFGSFSIRYHWDATNGQRNDRFSNIGG